VVAFSTAKVKWRYTSDNGDESRYTTWTGYSAQVAVLGGAAGSTTTNPLPKGVRPRHVFATDTSTGLVKRKITVFDETAFAAIVPDTTSLFINVDHVQVAATVRSKIQEKHLFQGKN
jgi:hypothetical protein